jgi:hypothetical protein
LADYNATTNWMLRPPQYTALREVKDELWAVGQQTFLYAVTEELLVIRPLTPAWCHLPEQHKLCRDQAIEREK